MEDEREKWKEWNAQGFIPGPEESEEEFIRRIDFCQNLEQNLLMKSGEIQLPFELHVEQSQEILQEAFPLTEKLYGIRPSWVPVFFSNYHLAPWHGGCAWIFQLDEKTPTAAFLQLRARFLSTPHYLGIYRRSELIAHELAHVGRMMYEEPQYEEFFAYHSSSSRWRRALSPIVQSSRESFLFILLLGLMILVDFAVLSIGLQWIVAIWALELLPLGLIGLALGRLVYRHLTLKKCLRNLESLCSSDKARHLLYRLRDGEIKAFSRMTSVQIEGFVNDSAKSNFRWRFLKNLFT